MEFFERDEMFRIMTVKLS